MGDNQNNQNREAILQRKIDTFYRGKVTFRYILDTIVLSIDISLTYALITTILLFWITKDKDLANSNFITDSVKLTMIYIGTTFVMLYCKDVTLHNGRLRIRITHLFRAIVFFSLLAVIENTIYFAVNKAFGIVIELEQLQVFWIIMPCMILAYFMDPLLALSNYNLPEIETEDTDISEEFENNVESNSEEAKGNQDKESDNESDNHLDMTV